MKNENKNAMPGVYSSFENGYKLDGLTKLEYAAIHIAAGVVASKPGLYADDMARMSIAIAKQIFKQLEDDPTFATTDTEL